VVRRAQEGVSGLKLTVGKLTVAGGVEGGRGL